MFKFEHTSLKSRHKKITRTNRIMVCSIGVKYFADKIVFESWKQMAFFLYLCGCLCLFHSFSSLSFFFIGPVYRCHSFGPPHLYQFEAFFLDASALRSCPSWFSSWASCKYRNEFVWQESSSFVIFPLGYRSFMVIGNHLTSTLLHLLNLSIPTSDFTLEGF